MYTLFWNPSTSCTYSANILLLDRRDRSRTQMPWFFGHNPTDSRGTRNMGTSSTAYHRYRSAANYSTTSLKIVGWLSMSTVCSQAVQFWFTFWLHKCDLLINTRSCISFLCHFLRTLWKKKNLGGQKLFNYQNWIISGAAVSQILTRSRGWANSHKEH